MTEIHHSQWEQYQSFLAGDKPLCVIERRKDSYTYAVVLHRCIEHGDYHVHAWHSPEGAELVLSRDANAVGDYIKLLHNAGIWSVAARAARITLGHAFGYDSEDIERFAREWTPEFCQCSKCVGVHRAIEAIA